MGRSQRVLALVLLHITVVHCFSWDIVVARSNKLEFYHEGTVAYMAAPATHLIEWIIYDPVHDRVLFADKSNSEYSAAAFDIATKITTPLIMKQTNRYYKRFAYDPATEILFASRVNKIYSFPIKSGNNKEADGDLVIDLGSVVPRELAVDSCGGYIYWTARNAIERALFNGSKREFIVGRGIYIVQHGLTIDSQKMYWIESQEYRAGFSIKSADLNGENRRTLYREAESDSLPDKLIVSKYFVSWMDSIDSAFFWQLPKNAPNNTEVTPKKTASPSNFSVYGYHDIAANYAIEERTEGVVKCRALRNLLPGYSNCLDTAADELFCVNGTKVSGENRCECMQGYIGERCDVSVCHNYCYGGDCDVADGGQPKCRCNDDYTGERCEVNVCHDHCFNNGVCSLNEENEPVCLCKTGYEGERCGESACNNFCFHGVCSVTTEGQPVCRCSAGYSGERCEVSSCHGYCLNDGTCSLNSHSEPVCQCIGQYKGGRCEVAPAISRKTYHIKFHWLPLVNGQVPLNAIIAGYEEGHNTYVARFNDDKGWLSPAKYVPKMDLAFIPWAGVEVNKPKGSIEVLCGSNARFVQTAEPKNLPKNAFITGHTSDGEPLYTCRIDIGNEKVLGKADPRANRCYVPYHAFQRVATSCEILVEPDDF